MIRELLLEQCHDDRGLSDHSAVDLEDGEETTRDLGRWGEVADSLGSRPKWEQGGKAGGRRQSYGGYSCTTFDMKEAGLSP